MADPCITALCFGLTFGLGEPASFQGFTVYLPHILIL